MITDEEGLKVYETEKEAIKAAKKFEKEFTVRETTKE
jgi:hypothetical protein